MIESDINLHSVKGLTWPPHSLFLFSVDSQAPVESLLGGPDSFKLLHIFCAVTCTYQHDLSDNISLHLISNKLPFFGNGPQIIHYKK